jgi:hypothetical protein
MGEREPECGHYERGGHRGAQDLPAAARACTGGHWHRQDGLAWAGRRGGGLLLQSPHSLWQFGIGPHRSPVKIEEQGGGQLLAAVCVAGTGPVREKLYPEKLYPEKLYPEKLYPEK